MSLLSCFVQCILCDMYADLTSWGHVLWVLLPELLTGTTRKRTSINVSNKMPIYIDYNTKVYALYFRSQYHVALSRSTNCSK